MFKGPLARIAPNILVTTDHEFWANTSTNTNYKRSNWFYQAIRLDWKIDNVVTNTNNDAHDFRRKQMIAGVRCLTPNTISPIPTGRPLTEL